MSNHPPKTECPGCAAMPISRRDALKYASSGFGLIALSALMADKAYSDLATRDLRLDAKVKNVIFCFMPGGVSHVDTFDPKPKLAELDGKSFDGFYPLSAQEDTTRTRATSPWQFHPHGQAR